MVSSMYEKSKLYDYGILATFAIVKMGNSFGILQGERPKHNSIVPYMEFLNEMQKDNPFIYTYVHQKKGSQEIPNLNKNILISNDPFHFFLMDEMENGFKNSNIYLSKNEKTRFFTVLSDFITNEKKIPTIKDFFLGSELAIHEHRGEWTLKVERKDALINSSCLITIDGCIQCWFNNDKEVIIDQIKSWIKKGAITKCPSYDEKKAQQILRLLKYFVGYDYEQDKDEAVAKEYFTEKEIDHLNKVIDRWAKADRHYANRFYKPERFICGTKHSLRKMIKEIKIGSLDDE